MAALTKKPSDPTLNFLSPEFDALKALNTPGLLPPVKNAPLKDNVSQCRSLLPEDHPLYYHKTGEL